MTDTREKSLKAAALTSVVASVALTLLKLLAGMQTGSISLLAESAHSLIDLVAALITYFSVRIASQPADAEHHFGHGKFENISALAETVLLWVTVLWVLYESVRRLVDPSAHPVEVSLWSIGVLVVSIIIDLNRSIRLNAVAKQHNSLALAADAMHFHNDMYTAGAALLGLICVHFGIGWADSVAGIVIAVLTFMMSLGLFRTALDQLTDRAPDVYIQETIRGILLQQSNVCEIRSLQIREVGAELFINVVISLEKTLSFEMVHHITDDIEQTIRLEFPQSNINIHPEPK